MLFNTFDFAIFLPIVFSIYWIVRKNLTLQNLFIVLASYVFYAWWDWRFLILIIFSSIVDFFIAKNIQNTNTVSKRKYLLLVSVIVNLGFLSYFKYFNFFLDNFVDVFTFFGARISKSSLNIVLPVGISFYTFQTLSYTIDVYRRQLKATNQLIPFLAYVSFFPQLVAGPIERATNLLPQFLNSRNFDREKAIQGLNLMVWGFFKKMVIADNCANYANQIFEKYDQMDSLSLLLGGVYFSFQIYCDFSGYSDIAIGASKLFGFELMSNFKFPYFSRDIGEFWRRWHISLSTWFRDYLYIPLGGSKGAKWLSLRNVLIIFIVSGFWHGANWTFIIWGFIHSLFYIPSIISGNNRRYTSTIVAQKNWIPTIKEMFQMVITFFSTMIAWVFFRSDSITASFNYLANMISKLSVPQDNRFGIIFVLILK